MSERLTKKDYSKWVQTTGYYNKKDVLRLTEIEHKLGNFEDFMEENNFKSLLDLKKALGKEFEIRDNPRRDNIEINGVTFNRDQLFILGQYDVFKTNYLNENHILKERWGKLERYITDKHNETDYGMVSATMTEVLLKMRELEKESKDEE